MVGADRDVLKLFGSQIRAFLPSLWGIFFPFTSRLCFFLGPLAGLFSAFQTTFLFFVPLPAVDGPPFFSRGIPCAHAEDRVSFFRPSHTGL